MGLQKQIANIFDGSSFTGYFHLNEVHLNYDQQTGYITFQGYADKQSFKKGRPAVASVSLTLGSGTTPSYNDVLNNMSLSAPGVPASGTVLDAFKTGFYNAAKALPDFKDATDIF
jgi:hypothetical protein